jgi:hypothetical protein
VHFHLSFAILERIFRDLGFVRKFAALSNRHEPDAEFVSDSRAEQESTRVNSYDLVDLLAPAAFQKQVDRRSKEFLIAKNGRDVFEDNSLFRKIGYVANSVAQFFEDAIHQDDASGSAFEVNVDAGAAADIRRITAETSIAKG